VLWEDDFSINALDEREFCLRPPVSQLPPGRFGHWATHIPAALIPGGQIAPLVQRDSYPIPDAADRENYMPESDAGYWLSGLGDCFKVMDAARGLGIEVHSVLDFGCASGRVARHFCIQCDIPEVWGTDVNARHIRWLSRYMPEAMKPVFNSSMPGLPLPDASIDVVCAFSVFTHIDLFETAWLAELRRILRPGGLCYLTVHNEDTWSALRGVEGSNRLLKSMMDTGKFHLEMLGQPMPGDRLVYRFSTTGPYRSQVFHSNEYLRRTWGRFFDVAAIRPCYHQRQSVVVMTRPGVSRASLRKAA
jgi:SAM-dependent methyltransferase